jgi:uroporphyrinogen decarboxylase
MEIITDSLMRFVKACINVGIDGFYTSTQGGEADRLPDRTYFDQCIRPYDLALMEEVNKACHFNILHICDYDLPYDDLHPYLNYPGHIVNASLELTQGKTTAREIARMFNRPFMGGLERKGILATGTIEQVRQEVGKVLSEAPERFILAADCTVPAETPWENLKTAIDLAHRHR